MFNDAEVIVYHRDAEKVIFTYANSELEFDAQVTAFQKVCEWANRFGYDIMQLDWDLNLW